VSGQDVIAFIRAHIGSVYTLELLLLLKRHPDRTWQASDLVRELRSSGTAVAEALNRLIRAGLVSENSAGDYAFVPTSPEHERIATEIESAYARTPISVVKAIVAAPDEKLRLFSNAFKLKE
jgi:DNA-binding GntR family transcriptional regulator